MRLPFVILIVFAAVGLANLGFAQQPPSSGDAATVAAFERSLSDIIARTEPAVVAVSRTSHAEPSVLQPQVQDVFGDLRQPTIRVDQSQTTGAGVIIDPAGLVLTQYLAVQPGDQHTVTTIHGRTYPAEIKAADPRSGLAILAITAPQAGEFASLPLGDATHLRKGQVIVVIGDPYAIRSDGEPTASWGTITNLARKAPSGTNLNNTPGPMGDYRTTYHHLGTLIQTDAKLGWSAGGGAVVNTQGELVGLTTTAATIPGHEQPAGYAIPVDETARRIIDTLKQGREVEYGLLGVTFRPLELPLDQLGNVGQPDGAIVQQVYPGSPAARAGLAPDDIITQVGNKRVSTVDGVQLAISTLPPGQPITVSYLRAARLATATVQLAKLATVGKQVVTERSPSWRGMRVDFATALPATSLPQKLDSGAIDPEGCVLVADVEPSSVAWQAGVRPGMFISHVGGERVTTPAEFQAAVEGQPHGVTIQLTQPVLNADQTEHKDLEIP